MLFVIFARRHSAVGVCAAVRVVAGYCWSATSVMGLPMQAHSSSANLKERLNSPHNDTFSSLIPAISHALK